jgi:hypothetical protein
MAIPSRNLESCSVAAPAIARLHFFLPQNDRRRKAKDVQ